MHVASSLFINDFLNCKTSENFTINHMIIFKRSSELCFHLIGAELGLFLQWLGGVGVKT